VVDVQDAYRCPAGEKLIYHYTNEEDEQQLRRYWTNACRDCALKASCTNVLSQARRFVAPTAEDDVRTALRAFPARGHHGPCWPAPPACASEL